MLCTEQFSTKQHKDIAMSKLDTREDSSSLNRGLSAERFNSVAWFSKRERVLNKLQF